MPWLLERLPPVLLTQGPRGLLWWQWLGTVAIAMVALTLGALASRLLRGLLARTVKRTSTTLDDRVLARVRGPLTLALDGLETVLRAHPKIWPDTVVVRFKELAASSLEIEVMASFTTSDWQEFLTIRQETLLAFMRVVEESGSSFAFPTRTIHVLTERSAGPALEKSQASRGN
jgi:MscS family membrane protein